MSIIASEYPSPVTYDNPSYEGPLQIGTVASIRFPPNWFDPNSNYNFSSSRLEDNDVEFIERGLISDTYSTQADLICGQGIAGDLVSYFINTGRAETISMVTATDMYAMGRDKGGAGSYTVRLIGGDIEVVHNGHNKFNIDFAVRLFDR